MIEKLVKSGTYDTYGVFEKEWFCAYAYFGEDPNTNILLFDYFAVNAKLRNRGYGTEAMKVILDACQDKVGVILEAEEPSAAESEEER